MASFVSATTAGGCMFEELCNGTRCNYVCDPSCLVDLRGEENMDTAVCKLIDAVACMFRNLECARDCTVEKFYIGKTFIKRRRKTKFDVKSPYTWKKNGISSRWQEHKKKDYGKDGLVVLAAVTKECVPGNDTHQEQYALCLEQRLLHHFRFHEQDGRLENSTFATGGESKTKYIAYAVYIAFSLREESSSDISTDEVENNNVNAVSTNVPTLVLNSDCMSPSVGMSTGISLVATEFDLKRLHLSSIQKHTDATTGIVSTDPFVSPTGARASCLANISIYKNSTTCSRSSTIPQATNVTCSSVSCTTSSSCATIPAYSVRLSNTATSIPPTVLTMPHIVSTVPAKSTSTVRANIQYTTSRINTTTLATNTNPTKITDTNISQEPTCSRVSTDPSVSPTGARASCLANTSVCKNSTGTTKRVLFATTATSTIPQATVTSSSVLCRMTSSSCASIPTDSVRLLNTATSVPPTLIPPLTIQHIVNAGSTVLAKSTSTSILHTPTTSKITTTATKRTNTTPTSTSPVDPMWPSKKKPKTANNPPPKGHTDATTVVAPSVIPTGARVSSTAKNISICKNSTSTSSTIPQATNVTCSSVSCTTSSSCAIIPADSVRLLNTATSVPPTVLTMPHIVNAGSIVPAKSTSTSILHAPTTSKVTTTATKRTNTTPTSTSAVDSMWPSKKKPKIANNHAPTGYCLTNESNIVKSAHNIHPGPPKGKQRHTDATRVTVPSVTPTGARVSSIANTTATSVPPTVIPAPTIPHIANAPCTVTGTYTAGSTIPAKSTSTNIQHTPTANRITTTSVTKYTNSNPIVIIDTSASPADSMWPSNQKPKTDKPANNPPPKSKQRHTDATRVAVPSVTPTGARVSSIANTTATSVPPTVIPALTIPHIANAPCTVPAKSTSTMRANIQYTTSKITTTLATNTNSTTITDTSISPEPSRVSTDPSVSPTRARASCLANTSDCKNSTSTGTPRPKHVLFETTATSTIPQTTNVTSSSVSCRMPCASIPTDSVCLLNTATSVPPTLIPALIRATIQHIVNAGSTIPAKSTSTSILHTPTISKVTTTAIKRTNTIPTTSSPIDPMWPSKKKPKTDKPDHHAPTGYCLTSESNIVKSAVNIHPGPPKSKQRHTDATRVAVPSVTPTGARVSSIANTTATSVPPTVIPALTIPHTANAPCTVTAKSTSTMRANIQYTTSKSTTTLATNTNPTTSMDTSMSPEPSRVSTDPSVSPTRARASCLANTSYRKNSTGTTKRVLFATTATSTIPQATNVTSSSVSCCTTSSSCASIPTDSVCLLNTATSVPPPLIPDAPCTVTGTYTAGSTVPAKSTSTNIQHTPTANRITTTSTTKCTNIDTSTSPADPLWPSQKKPKTANNPSPKGKQRHTEATRVAIPSVIPTGARVSSIAATSVPPSLITMPPHIANAPCTVTGTYTAGSTVPAKSTSTSIQYTTSRNTTSGVVVTSTPLRPSKKKPKPPGGTSAKVISIHKHVDLTSKGNKSMDCYSTTSLSPNWHCQKRKAEDVQYTTKSQKLHIE